MANNQGRFPEQPGHFSRSNELPPITNHNNRPPLPFPLSESSLPPLYYPGPPPTSYQLPAPPVATSLPPVSAVKQEVNGNVFGGHSSITSINFPTAAQQQPHDDPNFSQSFPTGGRPPFRYADYSPPSSSQPLLADPFATRSIDEYSQTRAGTRSTSPPRRRGEGMTPRAYLDSTVVPTLLDGLKLVATERPSDPLAYLGRYLLDRSAAASRADTVEYKETRNSDEAWQQQSSLSPPNHSSMNFVKREPY